jgi:flagellar hook assembly protein FlgD
MLLLILLGLLLQHDSTGDILKGFSPTLTDRSTLSLESGTHKISTSSSLLSISDVYAYPHPVPKGEGCHFHYTLSKTADKVNINIYTLNGCLVVSFDEEQDKPKGEHSVRWDGKDKNGNTVGSSVLLLDIRAEKDKEKDRAIKKFMVWEKD